MTIDIAAGGAIVLAYLTGSSGHSIVIFLLKDGLISGADIGSAIYDGSYSLSSDKKKLDAKVTVSIPLGGFSITGVSADDEPITFDVPFSIPTVIDPDAVIKIETPTGPVNAKFRLLREL